MRSLGLHSLIRPCYLWLTLLACVLLTACSDSPTSGSGNGNEVEEPLADEEAQCDSIELEPAQSAPLEVITIQGMDTSFGEKPGGVLQSDGESIPFLLEKAENSGHHEFVLPVHPTGDLEGGEAEVTVFSSDGSIECSGIQVTVSELEPASGEIDNLSQVMTDGVVSYFSNSGLDPDVILESEPTEIDPHLLPYRTLYKLFDADFEYSLPSLLSGSSPVVENGELSEESQNLIEAVLAASGIKDEFQKVFNANSESPASVDGSAGKSNLENFPLQTTIHQASIDKLAELMHERSAFAPDGAASGSTPGLDTAVLSVAHGVYHSLLAAVVDMEPQMVGAVTGTMSVIQSMVEIVLPDLLPSEITTFELQSGPETFNEDSEEEGYWDVQIEASSNGTTVNLDLLSAGFAGYFDHPGLQEFSGEVEDDFRTALEQIGVNLIGFPSGEGSVEFASSSWLVHVFADDEGLEEYLDWSLEHRDSWNGEPAFEFTDNQYYKPLREGEADLIVRLNHGPFGLYEHEAPEESKTLTVKPITVTTDPSIVRINFLEAGPEEYEVDIAATVENADNHKLEWEEEEGRGVLTELDQDANQIQFDVPKEMGTYTLKGISLANTGPRVTGEPERYGSVTIRVTDNDSPLTVSPDPSCVSLDSDVSFEADLDGETVPISDLDMTLDGPGEMTSNGQYTPASRGEVTIQFEYEDPDTGEIYSTETTFVVLESCGEMSVSSSEFSYETECVSAEASSLMDSGLHPYKLSNIFADFAPGRETGAHLVLSLETDIRDSGSWTRTFDKDLSPGGASGGETHWGLPTFYDNDGDEWQFDSDGDAGDGGIVLTLERTEAEAGGVMIPLFSGEFSMPIYNVTESERDDIPSDQVSTTVISGTFSGIPYSDSVNICH